MDGAEPYDHLRSPSGDRDTVGHVDHLGMNLRTCRFHEPRGFREPAHIDIGQRQLGASRGRAQDQCSPGSRSRPAPRFDLDERPIAATARRTLNVQKID